MVVAFRRHTLLPPDDRLYAFQSTIPALTRSSRHRCLQHHGISQLPQTQGDKPDKKRSKAYPIGYFHVDVEPRGLPDVAEVSTAQGKLRMFVAIGRTSKLACTNAPSHRSQTPQLTPCTQSAVDTRTNAFSDGKLRLKPS